MIIRKIRKNDVMLCIFITLFALILGGCGSSGGGGDGGDGDNGGGSDNNGGSEGDSSPPYSCYECTNPVLPRDCGEVCGSSGFFCNFYCSATGFCYDTEDEVIAACGDAECFTCDGGDNLPGR